MLRPSSFPSMGEEIADALGKRLGPVEPLLPDDPKAALRLRQSQDGRVHRPSDRGRPGDAGRDGRDGNVTGSGPRKVEFDGGVYCGRRSSIAIDEPSAGQSGIPCFPTPAWLRCRKPKCSSRSALRWPSPRSRGTRLHGAAARLPADRPSQPRSDLDHEYVLGPAARGKHVRVSLQTAGAGAGERVLKGAARELEPMGCCADNPLPCVLCCDLRVLALLSPCDEVPRRGARNSVRPFCIRQRG